MIQKILPCELARTSFAHGNRATFYDTRPPIKTTVWCFTTTMKEV